MGATPCFQVSYTQILHNQNFTITPRQQPVRRQYFPILSGFTLLVVNYLATFQRNYCDTSQIPPYIYNKV